MESVLKRMRSWRDQFRLDANDLLYQFDASRTYDPSDKLERITAPVMAVNSEDDQVNPPKLGVMEKEIKRVKRGRYVLLPTSDACVTSRANHPAVTRPCR